MDDGTVELDEPRTRSIAYSVEDLRALAMVVDTGSMTAAARKFSVSKSVLSRAIAKLERAANGPLFERGHGGMTLTAAGKALIPIADRAMALVRDADEAMRSAEGTPQGTLRVAAGALSGQLLVAPVIARMTRTYPQTRVVMNVTDTWFDPSEGETDVLLRLGEAQEAHLASRLIIESTMALYAHRSAGDAVDLHDPEAVERLGRVVIDVEGVPTDWPMDGPRKRSLTMASGPLACVSDPAVALGVLNSGTGVAMIPSVFGDPAAAQGRIVRALPDWSGPTAKVYAVLPPRRAAVPLVAAFLELLHERAEELHETAQRAGVRGSI